MLQRSITASTDRLRQVMQIARGSWARLRSGLGTRWATSDETKLRLQDAWRLGDCFESTEGMVSFDEALLIYRLANEVRDGCIVEVGSYRGRSSVALGRGSLDGFKAAVYTFDPHEERTGISGQHFGPHDRACFYRAMLETGCYKAVRLISLSSEFVAPSWSRQIGMLFIDGDRAYNAVKRDFECWAPFLLPNAKVALAGSSDPNEGPARLIVELQHKAQFSQLQRVGDLTVLVKSDRTLN